MLLLGFAIGLRRALPTGRGSRAAPILTGILGVSMLVGGVFPTDPLPGYPPGSTGSDHPTLPGLIHDANPLPFYAALTAVTLVLAWRFAAEPGRRGWMWYCLITGLLVPVTFGVSAALFDAHAQAGTYHGLWQRINLAIGLGWFGALALRLLVDHSRDRQEHQPPPEVA